MISRGRARWAKTERAQWSRDHQTNNTVPTQNGASCCAPFFFFCRSRFCFFFFFPRPTVLLFHRSRPPRRPPHVLAAFVHAVSNAMDLRWIPPRDSGELDPLSPPETRRIESIARSSDTANTVYTDGGGSTVDLPLDPWKHEVRWQVIYSRTPLKVNLWTDEFRFIPFRILRFHVYLSSFF